MNRINRTFKKLKKSGKKAFIAYITGGYPSLPQTERMVIELEKAGADIVEIGMPFSDPMADGFTIQKSSESSLASGTTLVKLLKSVKNIRRRSQIPIVLMSYLNPVYSYGMRKFVKDAVKYGIDGVIFPDLPTEEAGEFEKPAKDEDFYIIFLASPTSTTERLKLIARHSRGFIYYVSLTGITGMREHLPPNIRDNIRRIKRITDKPVCVGFGISNEGQARAISKLTDGVIVGSAIVKVIERNRHKKTIAKEVGRFAARLSRAIKSA